MEQQENARILFAYEEAIGFCVGDLVRDKDGVAAAVNGDLCRPCAAYLLSDICCPFTCTKRLSLLQAVFSEFANEVYAEGSTVQDYYKKLCDTYGHFVSCNHYYRASEKVQGIFTLDQSLLFNSSRLNVLCINLTL